MGPNVLHLSGPTALAQKKTQSDDNFVPGPRGTKMITGWASRRAGREEKLLISATAESFPCLFFLKEKIF